MSHTYPLAKSAHEALARTVKVARTRYEAEQAAAGIAIAALETEWLTPPSAELPNLLQQIETSPAHGFVQHYEDASGNIVLAITYWKLAKTRLQVQTPTLKLKPDLKLETDETDDLYFKRGRGKKRGKSKTPDPNQMDLFTPTDT